MNTKLRVLILISAAALAPLSTLRSSPATEDRQTNNLTVLLQQGLFEEQANRNLDAAIANYQTLATQFDKDRSLAATAIFRLGECYRAQGRTNEAAAQYQRILREFPDQQTLATLSRQDLAGLGIAAPQQFQERLQAIIAKAPPGSATASENADAKLWDRVKNLPPADLEKILPTLVPDEVLNRLLQQRNDAETKLAELRQDYNTNNLNVVRTEAGLKTVERQISERIQGIMQALKLRAEASLTSVTANVSSDDENQEIRRIQEMIQNSPDLINAADEHGHTPLERAAINGWLRVAAFLLDHGADVNAGKVSALNQAANAGNRAMVEFLLGRGADISAKAWQGKTPLHTAVEEGFQAVTEVLLANKANVSAQDDSGETPLALAARHNQPKIQQMLLAVGANANVEDNSGRTPLSYAAESGSPEMVKALLAAKADPNGGKLDTPLLVAIHQRDAATAELLLQAGANPNAKSKDDWQPTVLGALGRPVGRGWDTPMFRAIATDQFPMVQLLLKFKADPNGLGPDGSPLIFAALPHPGILAALLDAGANPNQPNNYAANGVVQQSESPLMAAVGNSFYDTLDGNLAAAKLLLAHGADPNARNPSGDTALHWAANLAAVQSWIISPARRQIVELLLDHHADPNARNNNGQTPLGLIKGIIAQTAYWPSAPNNPSEQKAFARELADLLRQHGALDNLPNWDRITVSRPSANYSTTIFYRGTNDWNRFTLFDLVGVQYDLLTASTVGKPPNGASRTRVAPYGSNASEVQNSLAFPDFSRIVIHRPSAGGTNWSNLKIDLARALNSCDCAADVPLQFGDVVGIPEADHVINEPWTGLSTNALFTLKQCLTRHLQITVNRQTTNITIAPHVDEIMPGSLDYALHVHVLPATGIPEPAISLLKDEPFMLWPVLENSKLMLASSDLSRVVVKRRDAATGKMHEWTVDCSNPDTPPNFWLCDGDEIEVPEK